MTLLGMHRAAPIPRLAEQLPKDIELPEGAPRRRVQPPGREQRRLEPAAQFVAARERALQRTAVLLTGDWALAEDLVQTALAKTWPRWERISGRDDPELYVRRVMVNTWATWWRRRWRGERASAAVPEGPAPGDVAADVAVAPAGYGTQSGQSSRAPVRRRWCRGARPKEAAS